MQIQSGFTSSSAWDVARKMYASEGLVGFFRGCVPPLWGSMVYRGVVVFIDFVIIIIIIVAVITIIVAVVTTAIIILIIYLLFFLLTIVLSLSSLLD